MFCIIIFLEVFVCIEYFVLVFCRTLIFHHNNKTLSSLFLSQPLDVIIHREVGPSVNVDSEEFWFFEQCTYFSTYSVHTTMSTYFSTYSTNKISTIEYTFSPHCGSNISAGFVWRTLARPLGLNGSSSNRTVDARGDCDLGGQMGKMGTSDARGDWDLGGEMVSREGSEAREVECGSEMRK
jgi:hypothetical protein